MLPFLGTYRMQQGAKRSNIAPLPPDDLPNVFGGHTHLQNAGGFSIDLLNLNCFRVIHKSTDDRAYKMLHVASPACRDLTWGAPLLADCIVQKIIDIPGHSGIVWRGDDVCARDLRRDLLDG